MGCKSALLLIFDAQSQIRRLKIRQVAEFAVVKVLFLFFVVLSQKKNTRSLSTSLAYCSQKFFYQCFDTQSAANSLRISLLAEFVVCKSVLYDFFLLGHQSKDSEIAK